MNKGSLFEIGYKLINILTQWLPLKNIIILESKPDFSDNTFALYEELIKKGYNKKYKFYWMLNENVTNFDLPENVFVQNKWYGSFFDKIKAKYLCARAKFIIDCNNFVYKSHKKQVRLHLKHGLPMKDASVYNHTIGETDLISVPSEYWIEQCAKEHNVSPDCIKPLGFPRNDVLKPKPHPTKNIIWMPTFRNHSNGAFHGFDFNSIMPLGLPFIQSTDVLKEINELFKQNGAYLLVRLHPAQDTSKINLSEMSNIKLCDNKFLKENNITLYSLLCYTDALVSDYSSTYYDYLMLSKPIALATADFEQYKKNNGILAKDKDEFMNHYPAVFLESYTDLIEFFKGVLNGDSSVYRCADAKEKYMGSQTDNSCGKIIEYLTKNYGL